MIRAVSSTAKYQRIDSQKNNFIRNKQKKIEIRKDGRKIFDEPLPIVDCQTKDGYFKAFITNINAKGVFIRTKRPFSAGEEIAMSFPFPISKNVKMVTGKVVRISRDGIGVVFKIFFREEYP